MRTLILSLLFAACAQPVEEPCLLRDSLKEGEASAWVENGAILLATTAECGGGGCIRDRTVQPGPPSNAALGYCAVPCTQGCLPGTQCTDVNAMQLCLRTP